MLKHQAADFGRAHSASQIQGISQGYCRELALGDMGQRLAAIHVNRVPACWQVNRHASLPEHLAQVACVRFTVV